MGKRIAGLFASALMAVLVMAPMTAWAFTGMSPTAIYVNGEDITLAEDHRVECGDGYAEFNPETKELTLDNANITKTYVYEGGQSTGGVQGTDSNCGIYSGNEVDLVIELVGENTITSGIHAWGTGGPGGSITIQGEGGLELTTDIAQGIYAYHDLVISGATVRVTSTSIYALHAGSGGVLRITDGARVEAAIPAENNTLAFETLWSQGDLIVEKNSALDVDGNIWVVGKTEVLSGATLTISNEVGQYGLLTAGGMSIQDSTVAVSSLGDYGIVADGLSVSGSTVKARAENSAGLFVRSGSATFDGGVVTVSSAKGPAMSCQKAPVKISNCLTTLSGATGALFNTTLDPGDESSYQWATSPVAASVLGVNDPYTSVDSNNNYLRFEPVGTTYELTLENGEGGGSYAAGTPVTISADAYTPSGHFGDWTIAKDPTGAVVLADANSASTTFIMPAGDVTLTANYASHDLSFKHHDAKAPTCTEAGWEAYDECACGYSTYKVAPATDHDWDEPAWSWNDNRTEFVATFTCANDPAHTEVLTAEPTASVQAEPTCTEPGVRLYSATVELGGEKYEATATAEIPATGHAYKDGVCTVCGAEDPDYVAPKKPKPAGGQEEEPGIPATGDAGSFFSAASALAGATAVAAGAVLRRRR